MPLDRTGRQRTAPTPSLFRRLCCTPLKMACFSNGGSGNPTGSAPWSSDSSWGTQRSEKPNKFFLHSPNQCHAGFLGDWMEISPLFPFRYPASFRLDCHGFPPPCYPTANKWTARRGLEMQRRSSCIERGCEPVARGAGRPGRVHNAGVGLSFCHWRFSSRADARHSWVKLPSLNLALV